MVQYTKFPPILNCGSTANQVDAREKLRWPPLPLATLSLQKEAITHLRLPGERMMKLAEELYQEGFISYPRTETDVFDPAYDLKVRLIPLKHPQPHAAASPHICLCSHASASAIRCEGCLHSSLRVRRVD